LGEVVRREGGGLPSGHFCVLIHRNTHGLQGGERKSNGARA
jgi:hypothetical protein